MYRADRICLQNVQKGMMGNDWNITKSTVTRNHQGNSNTKRVIIDDVHNLSPVCEK